MYKPFAYSFVLGAVLIPAGLLADTVVEEIVARVNNQIITRSEYQHEQQQLKDDCQHQDPRVDRSRASAG